MCLGPKVKVFPLHRGGRYRSQAKAGPLPGLVRPASAAWFYRRTCAIRVMTRNTNFASYGVKCYPRDRNSMLLTSTPVLPPQKIVLNYNILNWVSKQFVQVCFLSCYWSTYIIPSILPLGPPSLKYLLPGPLQKGLPTPAKTPPPQAVHYILQRETLEALQKGLVLKSPATLSKRQLKECALPFEENNTHASPHPIRHPCIDICLNFWGAFELWLPILLQTFTATNWSHISNVSKTYGIIHMLKIRFGFFYQLYWGIIITK